MVHAPVKPQPQDEQDSKQHVSLDIRPGMSAEQYVSESVKMHYGNQHQGFINGGLLQFCRKVGDMALAVIPKNRFWCAVGLTGGGMLGLKLAGIMSGKSLFNDEPIVKDKVNKLLRPLHGVLESVPHSSAVADRWKRVGALLTFTAVSFAGVMTGAFVAYRNSRQRNSHPESLEDYAARVGQHQGDKWRWLAASSGVFGSASGFYLLPYVPGVNYGASIAAYTVLNQDRKVMTPGLEWLSGSKTMSYLGLREGMDYICKYAVNNPSKDPAELEFLAYTVIAPIAHAANTKIGPECIKSFVQQVHEVRDKYWQEGGIPREQRKAALKDMETHFKGKGLDKVLYDCGIDTMKIDFTRLNGAIGKVGNALGATHKIKADQDAYHALATQWRKDWMPADKQPSPAEALEETLAMGQQPARTYARDDLKKPANTAPQRPISHQDALAAKMGSGAAIGV